MKPSNTLVVAIVWPSHPIQCAIETTEIASPTRMEVGSKEYRDNGGLSHCSNVDEVTRKGGGKHFVTDKQLSSLVSILGNLIADVSSIGVNVPPVEVERNEH